MAEMPSPAAVIAAAIGQMPGMTASGATPSTVTARAVISRVASGVRQRLVPYHTPAIALPSPYSPSSGPAAARLPWCWAKAMVAAITAAGLGISATLASSYRTAEMTVPAGQRTEAMSWLTTAAATGTALGAPVAGRLIDLHGAPAGYLFAFAAGLAAIAIAVLRRRDLALPSGPGPDPRADRPAHPEEDPSLPTHVAQAGRLTRTAATSIPAQALMGPAWPPRAPDHVRARQPHHETMGEAHR